MDVLDRLAALLREGGKSGNADAIRDAAIGVVQWGGVRQGNVARLRQMSAEELQGLVSASRLLDPACADLGSLEDVPYMNSGFSKIYALILDGRGFPIYDSRVACGLASLVQLYCESKGIASVPETLALRIPPSLSSGHRALLRVLPCFRQLRWGQRAYYAESNVKAAWLLGALAEEPPFAELEEHRRLLALQSAMFMIGYQPLALLGTSQRASRPSQRQTPTPHDATRTSC